MYIYYYTHTHIELMPALRPSPSVRKMGKDPEPVVVQKLMGQWILMVSTLAFLYFLSK